MAGPSSIGTKIPTLPAGTYDGALAYPGDRLLSWEHSPEVRVTADPQQWMDEMIKAERRLRGAREYLTEIVGEPVHPKFSQNSKLVTQNVNLARKEVFAFQVWDPNSPRLAENEVPRFHPDGKMYADDVSKIGVGGDGEPILDAARKLHPRPSANTHLETILYRLPKEHVSGLNRQAAADALRATEEISRRLSWNEAKNAVPEVQAAIGQIDDVLADLQRAREGAGSGDGSAASRASRWFGQLSTGGKAAVAGVALVGAGAAAAGVHSVLS